MLREGRICLMWLRPPQNDFFGELPHDHHGSLSMILRSPEAIALTFDRAGSAAR